MSNRKAFTLVEVLIVVLILAILAVIVVPRFSNASNTARGSMLADDLRTLRTQLEVYKAQHRGKAPGYPVSGGSPTEALAVAQMTLKSDFLGNTAQPGTPGFKFGPYLREMPVNPINGKSSVKVLGDAETMPTTASNQYGWVFKPSAVAIKADCTGKDESGRNYWDY